MIDLHFTKSKSPAPPSPPSFTTCRLNQTMLGAICDEGFSVESLSTLMGSELGCTGKVDEFFENMLAKVERLRKLVEESEAKALEQEDQNTKLRYRVSGLQSPS